MPGAQEVSVFWFRRDLRLKDNHGLYKALQSGKPVLPIFIFDKNILDKLSKPVDHRVEFIHEHLSEINQTLKEYGSRLFTFYGSLLDVWKKLTDSWQVKSVYCNRDYEPYAIQRDEKVRDILAEKSIPLFDFKDQVIFEKDEVLSKTGNVYHVFTPYRKMWQEEFKHQPLEVYPSQEITDSWFQTETEDIVSLEEMGFQKTDFKFPSKTVPRKLIEEYAEQRDFPGKPATSLLGVHLRFGTVSIRQLVLVAQKLSFVWWSELIWREFFMMLLFHYPKIENEPMKTKYNAIEWRNDEKEFARWCEGKTGYPIVDAGMRELVETGYMHNRVRMVTASFLVKHLLIDWRKGERFFAKHLLDYELSSNVGNWQWVASCGTDGAPYFRIFNPESQQKKFDADLKYVKKWVPEYGTEDYPQPLVEHKMARERALKEFESKLSNKN